jgi:hypothetical protein
MNKSESIELLIKALSSFQAEVVQPKKTEENTFFKKGGKSSKYADLAGYFDASLRLLAKFGLAITQTNKSNEKDVILETTLMHTSGQWIASELPLIISKNDMQGLGSAITYARRYALGSILGMAHEDDDGNGAAHDNQQVEKDRNDTPPRQLQPGEAATNAKINVEPSKTPKEAIEKLKAQVTKSTYNPNNKTATNHVDHTHRWGEYKFGSSKEQCKNKLPNGKYCNLIRHKDTGGPPPNFDDSDPLPF